MKNLSKYSIWLVMILAIGLFASGCANPWIAATDGELDPDYDGSNYDTVIEVSWDWDVDAAGQPWKDVAYYILEYGPSPEGPWTEVLVTGATTYTDNVSTGTVRFYRVTPYDSDDTPGKTSHVNGGMAGDSGVTAGLKTCMTSWGYCDQCIHQHVNSFLPDPGIEEDETWHGDTGTLHTTLAPDFAFGLGGLATFDFDNYKEICTNNFTFHGVQLAPVSVPSYDGRLLGSLEFTDNNGAGACSGCILYDLEVVKKQSAGGNYYINSGECNVTSGWECHNYLPDLPRTPGYVTPGESCPCLDCDCCAEYTTDTPPVEIICPWPEP